MLSCVQQGDFDVDEGAAPLAGGRVEEEAEAAAVFGAPQPVSAGRPAPGGAPPAAAVHVRPPTTRDGAPAAGMVGSGRGPEASAAAMAAAEQSVLDDKELEDLLNS
jgi:hypothetical protein